jgi:hypothetical protein
MKPKRKCPAQINQKKNIEILVYQKLEIARLEIKVEK